MANKPSLAQKPDVQRQYVPAGATLKAFHECNDFVRAIMGPFGSGKSSACVVEILIRAGQQKPSPDGKRRTRWAIVRNSFPELRSTTIKTWAQWCPTHFGKFNQDSPIIHHIKAGDLDIEVLFMALDKPDDMKKLLSLELTGAWINEAREVPKEIVDALTGRVGRYPAKMDGGPTWYGLIMDTNPPDDQHWYHNFEQRSTPPEWKFFSQPSGLSENAENTQNLPDKYYLRLSYGKTPDWIKVYIDGQYGYVMEGKPVYPMYLDSAHCSPTVIEANQSVSLFIGVDFGVSSAATIGQKLPDGQWILLDEFISDDGKGIKFFGENLASYLQHTYPGIEVGGCWYDPSGDNKTLQGGKPGDILRAATGWGSRVRPAPTNDIDMRLESVRGALRRMINGKPGILVSPKAAITRKGFAGGYHYKTKTDGNQTFEIPNKNKFSHPHDATQYMFLGGGEAAVVLNKAQVTNASDKEPRFAKGMDSPIFS